MITTPKDRIKNGQYGLAQLLAQWSINMNNNNQALWDVVRVAMLIMMTVIIFGVYFDAAFREVKVKTVPCSVTIENMARKLNVTLLDQCNIER
jgi:hypothetical protein